MDNKVKRDQIVALLTSGATNKEIVKQLKMSRKTIQNYWKLFQELGTTSGEPIPGRTRSIRTNYIMVYATKKKTERSPQGGFRKMTKYSGISRSSMWRIAMDDFQLTT